MSIDKETIREKLDRLEQAVKLLEKYRKVPKEDFLIDFTINSASQFNLILGIEIIVDIGNHILAEIYQVHPKEYKGIIKALGKHEIVSEKFAEENLEIAKLRNLIVHQYGEVDMKEIYNNLKKAPNVFHGFAKYFIEFLERI